MMLTKTHIQTCWLRRHRSRPPREEEKTDFEPGDRRAIHLLKIRPLRKECFVRSLSSKITICGVFYCNATLCKLSLVLIQSSEKSSSVADYCGIKPLKSFYLLSLKM